MILIAFKEVNKLNRTFLPLLFPLSNINKTKLVVVFYFAGMWTIRVGVSQAPKIFLFFFVIHKIAFMYVCDRMHCFY